MSSEPFVPAGFEPPRSLITEDFVLEPLGPQHNEADHAAWTSSIAHIRATPGYADGRWPPYDGMSLEENLADLTLAALGATLTGPITPTKAFLEAPTGSLRERAERIADSLKGAVDAEVVDSVSTIGGGGGPGVTLASAALSVPEELALSLRAGRPAVLGRLESSRCLLDLRAILPSEDEVLESAVRAAVGRIHRD